MLKLSDCKIFAQKDAIQFDLKTGKLSASTDSYSTEKLAAIRPLSTAQSPSNQSTARTSSPTLQWLSVNNPKLPIETPTPARSSSIETTLVTTPSNTVLVDQKQGTCVSASDLLHVIRFYNFTYCIGLAIYNTSTQTAALVHLDEQQYAVPANLRTNINDVLAQLHATPGTDLKIYLAVNCNPALNNRGLNMSSFATMFAKQLRTQFFNNQSVTIIELESDQDLFSINATTGVCQTSRIQSQAMVEFIEKYKIVYTGILNTLKLLAPGTINWHKKAPTTTES